MKPTFDLIESGWIPCVLFGGGRTRELGIRETLLKAHELREVHDSSPLVTVSLHRLLLAVLHRACGPTTPDEWGRLWQAGRFPEAQVNAYLDKWRDRFDLFSETHPFYQTAGLETDRQHTVARLAAELASGHNLVLFDHTWDDAPPEFTPADAARKLVAAQGFSLGFGQSGQAKLAGQEIALPYSADAPLLRGVTLWLNGDSLFETLMLNLPPHKRPADDLPVWERDCPADLRDRPAAGGREREPARGVLDRYTWQSRLVRLLPEESEGRTVVRRLCFTQGRSEDKIPQHHHDYDPMKVYDRDEKEGDRPHPLSHHKAAWRDAHALLALRSDSYRPAEVLRNAGVLLDRGVLEPTLQHGLHVVGIASAPGKAGKFLLWRHDRLPVPLALLQDPDLLDRLGRTIQFAEGVARDLCGRLRKVCESFLSPRTGQPAARRPDPQDVANLANSLDAQRPYWARLERHFHRLLQELPRDRDAASKEWGTAVEREARRAFDEACRKLGTSPRAIRAVARVSGVFSTQPRETAACAAAAAAAED